MPCSSSRAAKYSTSPTANESSPILRVESSASWRVPAGVPSVAHSPPIEPVATVRARKKECRLVRANGVTPPEQSGWQRSATCQVPAAVPSLRHSSRPVRPSSAVNRATDPRATKESGDESAGPGTGLMSLTRYGSRPKAGRGKDTKDVKDNRDNRIPDAMPLPA